MIGVVVYLAIVIALAAVLCGHQGEDFPPFRWLRAARARARRCTPASRPETASGDSPAAVTPLSPAERRTEPHTPSWARTDKEAA